MQTYEGILKTAAIRLDMTHRDYLAKRAAELKWCSPGQHWVPITDFGPNAARFDGIQTCCRDHWPGRGKGPSRLEKEKKLLEGLRWCGGCERWLSVETTKFSNGRCRSCVNAQDRHRYATDRRYRQERRQHAHARKRGNAPILPEVQDTALANTRGLCKYCGDRADTFDHVIPVSKGGTADISNIVPACVSCNSSKGNLDLDVWLMKRNAK